MPSLRPAGQVRPDLETHRSAGPRACVEHRLPDVFLLIYNSWWCRTMTDLSIWIHRALRLPLEYVWGIGVSFPQLLAGPELLEGVHWATVGAGLGLS